MSNKSTKNHLLEVLATATATYASVRSDGLQLGPSATPCQPLDVHLTDHGDARTLYRGRRPVCRSLDGRRSIQDRTRICELCPDRKHCVAQIRLDFLHDRVAYRLLLAYTSARNAILYLCKLRASRQPFDEGFTRLTVVDHQTWGELRLRRLGPPARGSDRA